MKRQNLLLASTMFMSLAAFAVSASAQQATTTEKEATEAKKEEKIEEVVVTGSRLRRAEFTSASPVQIITSERSTLVGLSDTTKVLQGSTIAATASQIDNSYTGFLVTGGPGSNTISLRGLGSNRTLVLLNGRRVGPAGVGGRIGPTDLNSIPNSVIDRTEILTDGASSIYGSDAIAGVVNIITKKNYSGGNATAFVSLPEESGGETRSFNISQGFTTDRFYGAIAADYYKQSALRYSDRESFACPQDRFTDANTGARLDLTYPDGSYKCTLGFFSGAMTATGTGRRYVYKDGAVAGGGYLADDLAGLHRVNATYTSAQSANWLALTRASRAENPTEDPRWLSKTLISPVERKSISFFGGYDLTGNTEVYFEYQFNNRTSRQDSWRQLFPTVAIGNPNNVFRTGNPNGYPASAVQPVIIIPYNSTQDINYRRAVVGIKGIFPDFGTLKNWTWDVYGQSSHSVGTYGIDTVYNDRVLATSAYATACNTAVLISATSCPTGGIAWTSKDVLAGNFTQAQKDFLFFTEYGKTTYRQQYVEADFSGDLFELPAGTVGATVGFMYRKESINDTPGTEAQRGNYWGLSTAVITKGEDTIKEAFYELGIPVLKGLPFVDSLTVGVSGRYSDYDSYGASDTYKVSANWVINSAWRLRASQGNSFRAPALYELFLGDLLSFSAQTAIDPCYQWGTKTDAALRANCAAQGIPDTYTSSNPTTGTGYSSASVYAGGGAGILQAETSDNRTVGLIFTPSSVKVQVAVDFFETKINNQVAQFGVANILNACYTSPNLSSPFCTLFKRDLTPGSSTIYMIQQVDNNYVNIAEQFMRGFDLKIYYDHTFGPVKMRIENQSSFIRKWTQILLPGAAPQDNLTFGVGSPEVVSNNNIRFDYKDYTLNWNTSMVGASSMREWYGTDCYTGALLGYTAANYCYDMHTEFYANHTISLRKRFDKWSVTGTIRNITNESAPSITSGTATRVGNAALTSQYDFLGRTFTLNVSRSW
ncbi:TonB-dependent receptor domain-containing protein [Asticcacaulis sp. YBE204]|uniref:TonB-dependent receptor domain-containing protein n=1 Tax=Asticcacaulis sp. YBE204 TaxID=1282363 RepID=UPI0012DE19DD|nr:TonB-dependent receptor [Asticcacaulis sp. YBE204]